MSRIDFGAKPLMLPQPVLIVGTYDENGIPNAMNAAWGITTDFNLTLINDYKNICSVVVDSKAQFIKFYIGIIFENRICRK